MAGLQLILPTCRRASSPRHRRPCAPPPPPPRSRHDRRNNDHVQFIACQMLRSALCAFSAYFPMQSWKDAVNLDVDLAVTAPARRPDALAACASTRSRAAAAWRMPRRKARRCRHGTMFCWSGRLAGTRSAAAQNGLDTLRSAVAARRRSRRRPEGSAWRMSRRVRITPCGTATIVSRRCSSSRQPAAPGSIT